MEAAVFSVHVYTWEILMGQVWKWLNHFPHIPLPDSIIGQCLTATGLGNII